MDLIKDKAPKWFFLVTTCFALIADMAHFMPLVLFAYIEKSGFRLADWFYTSPIPLLLDITMLLIYALILVGAVGFIYDWYYPTIREKYAKRRPAKN